MRRQGLSLMETVMSLVLLSTLVLSLLSLFHNSLRYRSQISKRNRALLLAQSKLAEIRDWATSSSNFLSAWAPYDGVSVTDPSEPEYQILSQIAPAGLAIDSPCQALESAWASHPRGLRRMPRALVPLRVQVSWSPALSDRLELLAWIGEPLRQANPVIQVTPASVSPVAPLGTFALNAQAFDTSGQPLANAFFHWYVEPLTSSATISPSSARDGRQVQVQHIFNYAGQPAAPAPAGQVQVRCRGIFRGQQLEGVSVPVSLQ